MNSFLRAEWKTIVGIVVFCGVIFGWFYHREKLKEEKKDAPYQYECLRAGLGLFDYELGASYDELSSKLTGFEQSTDQSLGIIRFENADHSIICNFRQNRLASIEYYPDMDNLNENCASDWEKLKKAQQVAAPVSFQKQIHNIYNGFILVQEIMQNESAEQTMDNTDTKDIGWIIVPE